MSVSLPPPVCEDGRFRPVNAIYTQTSFLPSGAAIRELMMPPQSRTNIWKSSVYIICRYLDISDVCSYKFECQTSRARSTYSQWRFFYLSSPQKKNSAGVFVLMCLRFNFRYDVWLAEWEPPVHRQTSQHTETLTLQDVSSCSPVRRRRSWFFLGMFWAERPGVTEAPGEEILLKSTNCSALVVFGYMHTKTKETNCTSAHTHTQTHTFISLQ